MSSKALEAVGPLSAVTFDYLRTDTNARGVLDFLDGAALAALVTVSRPWRDYAFRTARRIAAAAVPLASRATAVAAMRFCMRFESARFIALSTGLLPPGAYSEDFLAVVRARGSDAQDAGGDAAGAAGIARRRAGRHGTEVDETWTCNGCSFENALNITTCVACGAPPPVVTASLVRVTLDEADSAAIGTDADVWSALVSACPALRGIGLVGSVTLSEPVLDVLVQPLGPLLQELSLVRCRNVQALELVLPRLRVLVCAQCARLSEVTLQAPQLEEVDLSRVRGGWVGGWEGPASTPHRPSPNP